LTDTLSNSSLTYCA